MHTYCKLKLDDLVYKLEAFAETSPDRKEVIRSLRLKGLTYRAIGIRVGRTAQRCWQVINEHAV